MTTTASENVDVTVKIRDLKDEAFDCRVWIHLEECGGFSAEVVSLPGVVSQGETEGEAVKNLREAFQGAIETYRSHAMRIPWSNEVPEIPPVNVKEKRIVMHG